MPCHILVKAEGLDHIFSITTIQQACMEADDLRQTAEQQDSNGFMPTPLTDILRSDYDFPQTNLSLPESISDLFKDSSLAEQQEITSNMKKLADDQRNDPTLKEIWQKTESKTPNLRLFKIF